MKIEVLYEGNLHTIVTHSSSQQTLHTDAPKDNGGAGENFSPTDLVAVALGSCIATIMGIYAKNHGIDLMGMKIEVEKVMSTDAPRRIVKLESRILFPPAISKEQQLKLIEVGKNCPVHHSLHPNIALSCIT